MSDQQRRELSAGLIASAKDQLEIFKQKVRSFFEKEPAEISPEKLEGIIDVAGADVQALETQSESLERALQDEHLFAATGSQELQSAVANLAEERRRAVADAFKEFRQELFKLATAFLQPKTNPLEDFDDREVPLAPAIPLPDLNREHKKGSRYGRGSVAADDRGTGGMRIKGGSPVEDASAAKAESEVIEQDPLHEKLMSIVEEVSPGSIFGDMFIDAAENTQRIWDALKKNPSDKDQQSAYAQSIKELKAAHEFYEVALKTPSVAEAPRKDPLEAMKEAFVMKVEKAIGEAGKNITEGEKDRLREKADTFLGTQLARLIETDAKPLTQVQLTNQLKGVVEHIRQAKARAKILDALKGAFSTLQAEIKPVVNVEKQKALQQKAYGQASAGSSPHEKTAKTIASLKDTFAEDVIGLRTRRAEAEAKLAERRQKKTGEGIEKRVEAEVARLSDYIDHLRAYQVARADHRLSTLKVETEAERALARRWEKMKTDGLEIMTARWLKVLYEGRTEVKAREDDPVFTKEMGQVEVRSAATTFSEQAVLRIAKAYGYAGPEEFLKKAKELLPSETEEGARGFGSSEAEKKRDEGRKVRLDKLNRRITELEDLIYAYQADRKVRASESFRDLKLEFTQLLSEREALYDEMGIMMPPDAGTPSGRWGALQGLIALAESVDEPEFQIEFSAKPSQLAEKNRGIDASVETPIQPWPPFEHHLDQVYGLLHVVGNKAKDVNPAILSAEKRVAAYQNALKAREDLSEASDKQAQADALRRLDEALNDQDINPAALQLNTQRLQGFIAGTTKRLAEIVARDPKKESPEYEEEASYDGVMRARSEALTVMAQDLERLRREVQMQKQVAARLAEKPKAEKEVVFAEPRMAEIDQLLKIRGEHIDGSPRDEAIRAAFTWYQEAFDLARDVRELQDERLRAMAIDDLDDHLRQKPEGAQSINQLLQAFEVFAQAADPQELQKKDEQRPSEDEIAARQEWFKLVQARRDALRLLHAGQAELVEVLKRAKEQMPVRAPSPDSQRNVAPAQTTDALPDSQDDIGNKKMSDKSQETAEKPEQNFLSIKQSVDELDDEVRYGKQKSWKPEVVSAFEWTREALDALTARQVARKEKVEAVEQAFVKMVSVHQDGALSELREKLNEEMGSKRARLAEINLKPIRSWSDEEAEEYDRITAEVGIGYASQIKVIDKLIEAEAFLRQQAAEISGEEASTVDGDAAESAASPSDQAVDIFKAGKHEDRVIEIAAKRAAFVGNHEKDAAIDAAIDWYKKVVAAGQNIETQPRVFLDAMEERVFGDNSLRALARDFEKMKEDPAQASKLDVIESRLTLLLELEKGLEELFKARTAGWLEQPEQVRSTVSTTENVDQATKVVETVRDFQKGEHEARVASIEGLRAHLLGTDGQDASMDAAIAWYKAAVEAGKNLDRDPKVFLDVMSKRVKGDASIGNLGRALEARETEVWNRVMELRDGIREAKDEAVAAPLKVEIDAEQRKLDVLSPRLELLGRLEEGKNALLDFKRALSKVEQSQGPASAQSNVDAQASPTFPDAAQEAVKESVVVRDFVAGHHEVRSASIERMRAHIPGTDKRDVAIDAVIGWYKRAVEAGTRLDTDPQAFLDVMEQRIVGDESILALTRDFQKMQRDASIRAGELYKKIQAGGEPAEVEVWNNDINEEQRFLELVEPRLKILLELADGQDDLLKLRKKVREEQLQKTAAAQTPIPEAKVSAASSVLEWVDALPSIDIPEDLCKELSTEFIHSRLQRRLVEFGTYRSRFFETDVNDSAIDASIAWCEDAIQKAQAVTEASVSGEFRRRLYEFRKAIENRPAGTAAMSELLNNTAGLLLFLPSQIDLLRHNLQNNPDDSAASEWRNRLEDYERSLRIHTSRFELLKRLAEAEKAVIGFDLTLSDRYEQRINDLKEELPTVTITDDGEDYVEGVIIDGEEEVRRLREEERLRREKQEKEPLKTKVVDGSGVSGEAPKTPDASAPKPPDAKKSADTRTPLAEAKEAADQARAEVLRLFGLGKHRERVATLSKEIEAFSDQNDLDDEIKLAARWYISAAEAAADVADATSLDEIKQANDDFMVAMDRRTRGRRSLVQVNNDLGEQWQKSKDANDAESSRKINQRLHVVGMLIYGEKLFMRMSPVVRDHRSKLREYEKEERATAKVAPDVKTPDPAPGASPDATVGAAVGVSPDASMPDASNASPSPDASAAPKPPDAVKPKDTTPAFDFEVGAIESILGKDKMKLANFEEGIDELKSKKLWDDKRDGVLKRLRDQLRSSVSLLNRMKEPSSTKERRKALQEQREQLFTDDKLITNLERYAYRLVDELEDLPDDQKGKDVHTGLLIRAVLLKSVEGYFPGIKDQVVKLDELTEDEIDVTEDEQIMPIDGELADHLKTQRERAAAEGRAFTDRERLVAEEAWLQARREAAVQGERRYSNDVLSGAQAQYGAFREAVDGYKAHPDTARIFKGVLDAWRDMQAQQFEMLKLQRRVHELERSEVDRVRVLRILQRQGAAGMTEQVWNGLSDRLKKVVAGPGVDISAADAYQGIDAGEAEKRLRADVDRILTERLDTQQDVKRVKGRVREAGQALDRALSSFSILETERQKWASEVQAAKRDLVDLQPGGRRGETQARWEGGLKAQLDNRLALAELELQRAESAWQDAQEMQRIIRNQATAEVPVATATADGGTDQVIVPVALGAAATAGLVGLTQRQTQRAEQDAALARGIESLRRQGNLRPDIRSISGRPGYAAPDNGPSGGEPGSLWNDLKNTSFGQAVAKAAKDLNPFN